MRAYNLFRRRSKADLYCAVPEDMAVPEFLRIEKWEYACALDDTHSSSTRADRIGRPPSEV